MTFTVIYCRWPSITLTDFRTLFYVLFAYFLWLSLKMKYKVIYNKKISIYHLRKATTRREKLTKVYDACITRIYTYKYIWS